MFRIVTALFFSSALIPAPGARSADAMMKKIAGPISAEVIRVVDGDTVEVVAFPWPQQSVDVLVRLRGIDAPEIHAHCAVERQRALDAKERLSEILNEKARVLLTNISGDKYFGRVVADLGLVDGEDAASILLLEDLVSPYDGGRKPSSSCQSED